MLTFNNNVIKIRYLDKTLYMPLNNPSNVTEQFTFNNIDISKNFNKKDIEYDAYTIYLTEKCNLKCKYCFENKKPLNSKINVTSIINFIKSRSKKNIFIRFFGGEPLLQKKLIYKYVNKLNLLKKEGYKISYNIVTNGILLDQKFLDMIKLNNFTIVLSFDVLKKMQLKNRSPQIEEYKKIIENIDLIKKNNLQNRVMTRTMIDINEEISFVDIVEESVRLGLTGGICFDFPYVPPNSIFSVNNKNIENIKKAIEELTLFYIEKLNSMEINFWSIYNINTLLRSWLISKEYIDTQSCGFGINMIVVDIQGNIYPCPCFVEEENFKLGNIEFPYLKKEIENDIKYMPTCRNCNILYLCKMRCFYDNYINNGDIYSPNIYRCEIQKEFIKSAIYILNELKNNPKCIKKYKIFLTLQKKLSK